MRPETTESPSNTLKVLLVADEEIRGTDFMAELKRHVNGRSAEVEVFVTVPALADSAIDHEMANFDGPIKKAGERLDNVLAELKSVGIEAVGQVGDGDPVVAIGDGLREFDADEIIVVAHREADRKYAERDLWKNIEHEFHQPIVELIVDAPDGSGAAPHVVETHEDAGRGETEQEVIDRTRNFPPVNRRDLAGILIGFIGTFALGLIAVGAGSKVDGDISGGSAAVLLLAIGAFLINAAHIVGLLFFQSVRYTGIWEKFMARLAILYTVPAVIVALIIWISL